MYGTAYLMDELAPSRPATLEGQVLEFADEIASLTHDVEDGLRSRVFKIEDVRTLLKGQIKSDSLNELLGLSPHFGNLIRDDTRLQSRAMKFHALLDEIYAGPCTMGIVLAFLRNMLLSNIIEASAWRLRACLAGSPTSVIEHQPASTRMAGPDELIWLNFSVAAPPSPTQSSYCADAWEVDPANRNASLQTFRRADGRPEPTSDRIVENVKAAWNMKTADPQLSRHVMVQRESGQVIAYPLGNVCITIDGAKIIGYHSNMLEFRRELRKGFIPEHLHRAPVVFRMNNKGQRYLTQIFDLYYNVPRIMHRSALRRFDMWEKAVEAPEQLRQSKAFILRIVENLQGMTDRYLTEEYNRLFQPGAKMEERNEMDMVDME
jgi:dGTP triphosphohydrolase